MTILLIEYRVDDVDGWQAVFDADPMDRAAHGVTHHWIDRDADDPNHLMVVMTFATPEQAEAFREALAPVWDISGAGQSWVLERTASSEATTNVNRFLYRLIPPRPTFPADMSEEEGAIMAQHFTYWAELEENGLVVVLGPVLDPRGTWGLGIIEGDTEDEVRAIACDDPAVKSGMSTFEVLPMADPYVRSSQPV